MSSSTGAVGFIYRQFSVVMPWLVVPTNHPHTHTHRHAKWKFDDRWSHEYDQPRWTVMIEKNVKKNTNGKPSPWNGINIATVKWSNDQFAENSFCRTQEIYGYGGPIIIYEKCINFMVGAIFFYMGPHNVRLRCTSNSNGHWRLCHLETEIGHPNGSRHSVLFMNHEWKLLRLPQQRSDPHHHLNSNEWPQIPIENSIFSLHPKWTKNVDDKTNYIKNKKKLRTKQKIAQHQRTQNQYDIPIHCMWGRRDYRPFYAADHLQT